MSWWQNHKHYYYYYYNPSGTYRTLRSSWKWTWPDIRRQIRPEPEVDIGRAHHHHHHQLTFLEWPKQWTLLQGPLVLVLRLLCMLIICTMLQCANVSNLICVVVFAHRDAQYVLVWMWSADVLTCSTKRTRTRLGNKSFSIAGPCLSNSLPVTLRDRDISLVQFKWLLKTLWFV